MMQDWFREAKLGIFIHWGIYAVKGITESWSFFWGDISHEDYMKQCQDFTAEHYDPQQWAKLFKQAGADYVVLTTKHHDGVALWDTKQNDLSVVQKTPAKRDLIAPYCEALRDQGIKVGLYFSQLDWSHPDYASVMNHKCPEAVFNKFAFPKDKKDHPERWGNYLKFHRGQLQELMTQFAPVDLLWFDGDWERSDEQWDMKGLRDFLHGFNPNVVINSRIGQYGDYATPEQGFPTSAPDGEWEFCMTINDTWGYQPQDDKYKSLNQLLRYFIECISMGGRLLLDVGPMADGTIPQKEQQLLLRLGDWIKKHDEAIHGTEAGLPAGYFYGSSTISKDKETIYLFFYDIPRDSIAVKGIRNAIKRISVLGDTEELNFEKFGGAEWMEVPGILWIDLPLDKVDDNVTVIKVELEGPLDLYQGQSGAIEQN